jgi:hypothetical protein
MFVGMSPSVKKKLQIKGSILIRHVCRDVIFCKEKNTNQGKSLIGRVFFTEVDIPTNMSYQDTTLDV